MSRGNVCKAHDLFVTVATPKDHCVSTRDERYQEGLHVTRMSIRVEEDEATSELHRMPGEDPYFVALRGKKKGRCLKCCTCTWLITAILTGGLAIGLGLSYNLIQDDVQSMIDKV